MERFTIRRAGTDDAEAICAVHKVSVRGLCAGSYTKEQIEAWVGPGIPQDCRDAMRDGEVMFVADYGGDIVGFGGIKGTEIRAVYVEPERGRGSGALLLRALEQEAADKGEEKLHLTASLNSVGFYEAMGYQARGEAAVGEIQGIAMEKQL